MTQKKTELTKSLITPEILFSLKQKFYGIMYNLCSQHLQSLNSIQQKLIVLQPLKDMFQMRAPALQADLDSPGKVLNDPPALLSRDGSDGCCDGCFEVRDGLGVVLIHPVLEVTPQVEVWGVQVW